MKRGGYVAVATLLAVLMTLGGIFTGYTLLTGSDAKAPAAGVTLTPSRADVTGVDPAASFRLASAEPIPLGAVEKLLSVRPAVELRYEPADKEGKAYTVKPAQPLDPNRVYTFRLNAGEGAERAYQWSFQTRAEFRILGTLPRHQATGVPVDTGIEFTFSHENYGDAAPLFSISPKAEGRFERHKKTLVFVPASRLLPGTVYTVTLNPGLGLTGTEKKLGEEYRFAFETAPAEEGQKAGGGYLYVSRDVQEFPTGVAPYFQMQYYRRDGIADAPVGVTVYRYKDAAQFISALKQADKVPWWAEYSASRFLEETRGLTQALRFEDRLKQMPGHHTPYLVFPEPLAAGYYVAELKVDDQVRQVRFQVTDLASHFTLTSTRSLVWVNDVASRGPVAGAEVAHPGGKATTSAEGLAEFPTPGRFTDQSEAEGLYLQVNAGSKEAVVGVRAGGYSFYDMPYVFRGPGFPRPQGGLMGYWKYLSLDRPLYKPGDTVRLFGVLLPREAGADPVGQVTAAVVRRDYYGFGTEPQPLSKALLAVVEGSYYGSLSLPNLKPGSYELQVTSGGEYVMSRWFEVQAYTKPAYQISASVDRRAIFTGERATFTVETSFFEGTPVPGLQLDYSIGWGRSLQGKVTTGQDGTASIPFTPDAGDVYNSYGGASQAWFNIRASLPEAGEINTGTGLQVFTRNVMLRPSVEVEEGVATIKAAVNRISLDKLNAGDGWDYTGAPLAGARVTGTLIEQNWIREETGEYYDFIEKRVVKQYHYRFEPKEIESFTAATDAEGKIAHKVSVNPEKSYQVKLQVGDTNGLPVMQEWHFSGRQYQFKGRGGNEVYKSYSLAPEQRTKESWGAGEEVALQFLENETPVADRARSFLFYQARMGLQEYRLQDSATYRFPFRESDVPNTTVKGIYFDGRQYREAWEYPVRFDSAQRELKVTVRPDREIYRPGDTVGVVVEVTGKDGRPVMAHVNLSLVDEALFALRGQEVRILQELYGDHVPSGILRTRSTHEGLAVMEQATDRMTAAPAMAGSATKMALADASGSGGSAAIRSDFQDAAFFTTVSTDASGKASTTIRLPDNLTTWRMTYQAFAPGMAGAASGTEPIAVKIPFFVDTVMGESYLTGDRPVISVRSFGAELLPGQDVSYEITVQGPTGTQTVNRPGKAFESVAVPLDRLEAGTYSVQVLGTAGRGLADALKKEFTVVDSYLRQQKVEFHLLSPQTQIKGAASGITTLTFTDHRRGRYLQLLQRMHWSGGSRFEQKLARAVATDLLKAHFDLEERYPEPEWNPGAFQAPDGSIAILPYSDGDLYLSALTADLAAGRFDKAALASYFLTVLEDSNSGRERAVIALYGLGALGEPVLQQVRTVLGEKDLTLDERLYLALALTALGDLEGARPVWRELWQRHGEQLGSNARLNAGRDQDEILAATARAAALAGRLGEPEATALVGYMLENPAKEVLLLLEQLLAAQAALPELAAQPVAFAYVQGGQEKRMELKPGQALRWHLTPEALADLQVTAVEGQVGLTVNYEAPLTPAELRREPGYELSRTYAVEGGGDLANLKQGDLVRITLTYRISSTAPAGGYEITDYLPSGLRMVERPWQHGMDWRSGRGPSWPMTVNGQQVTFWAWEKGDPIYYYARVVSPGEFTAEQPVLQHQRSGAMFGHGDRDRIQIGW